MRPAPLRCLASLAAVAALVALAGCDGDDDGESSPASRVEPRLVAKVRVGGAPVAVAVGEGAVWVADNAGGTLRRIDPAGARPRGAPIRVGRGPVAVATGGGSVWVAGGDGTVARVEPASGRRSFARGRVSDPAGIAVGEGAVWVTSGASGTVTRLDPASGARQGSPIQVGARPSDVVVGGGSVWVANADDGTVTQIDPGSGKAERTIEVARGQVLALAYGEDGLWVAKADDRLAERMELVRIDPQSSKVEGKPVAVRGAIPVRLAAGEGAVWITQAGGVRPPARPRPSTVLAVVPESLRPAGRPVRVGDRPGGIAVGKGFVWVVSPDDGTIAQIDPRR